MSDPPTALELINQIKLMGEANREVALSALGTAKTLFEYEAGTMGEFI
jgi:hypothetical protein